MPIARQVGFNFNEAYSLMKYVNEVDGYVEWLWNSRDGISPFTITDAREDAPPGPRMKYEDVMANSKRDNPEMSDHDHEVRVRRAMRSRMSHADWHEDVFVPNFVPYIGMRVFTDKEGFDKEKHQHNVEIKVVDAELRWAFQELSSKRPFGHDLKRKRTDG